MQGLFQPDSVIQSLLDTDFYKYLMQQAIFDLYHGVEAKVAFHCFSDNDLGLDLHYIKEEIEKLEDLRFEKSDIWYLSQLGRTQHHKSSFFKSNFLSYLKHYRLSSRKCSLSVNNQNQLFVDVKGSWIDILHFQIFILTIVQQSYHQRHYPKLDADLALQNIDRKVKDFIKAAQKQKIDLSALQICDLGTRNRFNYQTQWRVLDYLRQALPEQSFIGTSNLHIAREMNIPCIGSQGHEWFMAHQQLSVLHQFQCEALSNWVKVFQGHPGLALTGTLSFDAFLQKFNLFYAKLYDGIRINAQDPIPFIERIIEHYKGLGIDPKRKYLMISDQLDLDTHLLNIYHNYHDKINLIFGLRETLTCGFSKYKKINMIMDLVECERHPVARFSQGIPQTSKAYLAFVEYLKTMFES
tara:strand:- start:694 stop:1923 length:1230 start_codon:yes stop_codon:yes gene_type:complete